MVQLDLQRIVLVGSVVAVIAKAIPGAASHGRRHAILVGVRSRKGVIIRRSLVVGQRGETHNRRLVRVVRVTITLEYMASVVPNIGHIDAGLVGKLPLNGCIPRVHHRRYEFVRPNVGPDVQRQAGASRPGGARPKQRKDSIARNHWELIRGWPGGNEVESRRLVVVGGAVDGLVGQHRQVLRDGMSKERSEDADVVAASVAHANHRLGVYFIGDSQPRGKLFVVVASVSVHADATVTCHSNHAFRKHREAAVSLTVYILRRVELPTQTVVDGQLLSRAPGVLRVQEIPVLSLNRILFCGRANISVEGGCFPEQERSDVQTTGAVVRGTLMVKVENAGAVRVRRNSQVGRVPQIDTELELVISFDLRPVVDELVALLFFNEGAIAAADIEAFSDAVRTGGVDADGLVKDKRRQTAGRGIGSVPTGKPESSCRGHGWVVLRGMRIVAKVSESEVG